MINLRILIIFPNGGMLLPQKGDEIRVYNLAKSLSTKNEIIILESNKHDGKSCGKLEKFVKDIYFFNDYRIGGTRFGITFMDFNPSFLFKLLKILKNEKIDIIQVAFPWGIVAAKILVELKNYRIPVIYDAHNVQSDLSKITATTVSSIKKPIILYYSPMLERFLVKFVNHIIAVSNEDRNKFIEKYGANPGKITVIPSGTNIINISSLEKRSKVRGELGIRPEEIIVVFHGTYVYPPNKEAVDLIINYIASKIMEINRNVLFIIAGSDTPVFKKDNVKSVGFVDDLYSLLNIADIAIVPLLRGGGTKLKILDYMGMGLPIVTTKKGIEGINAKNCEHAIIVDDVNEEFIDAIKYLIGNEQERKRIGANARRLAEEEYDWAKVGEKLDKLYKGILEEKKRANK